jgi:glycosyltransferase involved in cell wall biosynthesis
MAVDYSVGMKDPDSALATKLNHPLGRNSGPEENAAGEAPRPTTSKIAILIPCYNEEQTVAEVVTQFRAQLPAAAIFVFDNNSSDRTVSIAQAAGAQVFHEQRQGKGYVTQTMFRMVDADAYVIVDGDGTYPATAVHRLLAPVLSGDADMVVGSRLHADSRSEFKQLNALGNRLVLGLLNAIFRVNLTDILSGYRAFNRKFVKSLPLFGGGFEIETELTIKAIERGFRIIEIPIDLTHRPAGSHSKIKFFRDGAIILNTLLALFRDYKPLTFFGSAGLLFLVLALVPGLMVVVDFVRTGFAGRLSLAVLTVVLAGCGLLSITVGLILHSIARRAQEFEYQLQVLAEQFGSNSVALKTPTGSAHDGR